MSFTRRKSQPAALDLDLNSPTSVAGVVDAVVQHALDTGYCDGKVDVGRVQYLRISTFPFCARNWWLNQTASRSRIRKENTMTMFFTRVGTTVHEVFQEALSKLSAPYVGHDYEIEKTHKLPMNALLVQDWKCVFCKRKFSFCPHPKTCPDCGHDRFHADEHELAYSKHVLGHMDGTYAFPHAPGEPYSKKWIHIPIDYKTASLAVLDSGLLPYRGNSEQLLSYGALKAEDGYNVPGVCLIYVRRDNPHVRKVYYIPLNQELQLRKILKWEESYIHARQVTTLEGFQELPVRTKKNFETDCDYCPYVKACEEDAKGNPARILMHARTTLAFLQGKRMWMFPTYK